MFAPIRANGGKAGPPLATFTDSLDLARNANLTNEEKLAA